jgi:hypothetical protein
MGADSREYSPRRTNLQTVEERVGKIRMVSEEPHVVIEVRVVVHVCVGVVHHRVQELPVAAEGGEKGGGKGGGEGEVNIGGEREGPVLFSLPSD